MSLQSLGINSQKSFSMILAGKSNSGKSHLLRYLMREINIANPFDYGLVFSNTAFEGSFSYIPQKYIFEEFDENVLKNLIRIQKKNLEEKIHKRAFVILDDCCSESEYLNSVIKKLFIMGRHFNITTVITTQYIHLCPPVLRANSNFSIFFDIGQGYRECHAIYEWLGQKFKNYDEFKQFYYRSIENNKFILYDQHEGVYKIFRAPEEIPTFYIKFNKSVQKK